MMKPLKSRQVLLAWLEWGLLLVALGSLTVTEVYRPYVAAGVILLAASFGVRALRTGRVLPRSGLEIPWILFLFSAGVATWIAYDRPTAFLQFARILALVIVFYAVLDSNEDTRRWVAAGFVGLAAGLAVYWPSQYDFASEPVKLAVVTRLGIWVHAYLPALPGPSIHSNVAGGTLAMALPFGLALVWDFRRRGQRGLAWIFAGLAGLISAGLLLTSSRGAWLGILGAAGLVGLAWVQGHWFPNRNGKLLFWGLVVLLGLALVGGLAASGNLDRLAGKLPDPSGALQGRTRLWAQGLPLIRDYVYTGSGLMSFRMVYAVYGILINDPFQDHIHNAYLEVWIEQGVLGFVALLWGGLAMARGAWRALPVSGRRSLAWGGIFALTVAAVHGIFDVVFYVERTLPLLGLAAGFAALLLSEREETRELAPAPWRVPRWGMVTVGILLLLAIFFFRRPLLGAWQANLGALAQSRLELARYDPAHFDELSLDQVRQQADLSGVEAHFRGALAWDAHNPTALQRLSEIALSRGEYTQALDWMQSAWEAGQRGTATRLLLGDALLASGQGEAAVEVLRSPEAGGQLTWAVNRLLYQAWYRYWTNGDYPRAAEAWRVVLLLDPSNKDAAYWEQEALKRTNP